MDQVQYVDERFVVNYMNPRTAHEHRIVVLSNDLEDTIEYFVKRKQIVSVLPFLVFSDDTDL